jgi:site-specific DNA-cytosine methylase
LLTSQKAFTLATSNFHTVFLFEATRVEDVRIYENYSPTVARYWGTGGARVPYVFEPKSAFEENWSESEVKNALRAEASKSSHAIIGQSVRRLTPTECERLQGFPDGWTDGQADSHRYKQMGNAVAVPVVEWIIGQIK